MATIPSACESAIQVWHACSLRASATRAFNLERVASKWWSSSKNLNTLIFNGLLERQELAEDGA